MYKVDPILLEKFQSMQQTRANNNDPNPLAYITRNRTPITTQRFWEKLRVTSTVGTRSSIAVRRPEGNLTGDVIFVAQVENGDAVIRKAEPRINLTNMVWSHVMTINDVSELSIMFDGYMKMVEGKVESYTTGNLPIVFYVDSDNSLKGWNMNNDIQFTISDTAYNVASVRGLYSEAADLNDGIFVFYTNAEGELWEARVLGDEVVELTQITLKPEGVTGWEDVWASLTFDYRVVLQLKGNDGNTYSLLSASRPSGFMLPDNPCIKDISISARHGLIPPNLKAVYNVGVNIIERPLNYGKYVVLEFDGPIFNVSDADIPNIIMISALGSIFEKSYHPKSIGYYGGQTRVKLEFDDFNNSAPNMSLVGTNVVMGGEFVGIPDFNISFVPDKIHPIPGLKEHACIPDVSVKATLSEVTYHTYGPQPVYAPSISSFSVNAQLFSLEYINAYSTEESSYRPSIIDTSVSAVLCDIGGVPI